VPYKVDHVILKGKKPFEDGELVKEVMMSAIESLFEGSGNKAQILSSIMSNCQLTQ
jgi:hypothetical protein